MNKRMLPLVPVMVLLILSLLPLFPFLSPGLPVTHDGKDHVVRIASFYASLQEGTVIPRWAGNLNWGYGHPILMFLYPFSSYAASLFRFTGFSFTDATKAVFILAYTASVLSMYLWMNAAWGKRAGFIGALLYGFAPYRFVDMYVRGAIGEHTAFIFPPLICFFLYKLARKQMGIKYYVLSIKYGIGLSLVFAAFILSHNAISIMFLPVIGLYVIYLFIFETNKSLYFILYTLYSILLGFGLSSFFWIPAFIEGKYTLRAIVTAGEPMNRFVLFRQFFYSPWNYGGTDTLTKSVGYVQWFGVLASMITAFKTKDKKIRILFFALFSLLIASLFIMTSASEFIWVRIRILQNFQFPWRFLSLTAFTAAAIGGISIAYFTSARNNKQRTKNFVYIACCLLLIASTFYMWRPKGFSRQDESSYAGVYAGTTDTGESSPIWSVRFMEHTPVNPMEVIEGEAVITAGRRISTIHEYTVNASERSRIVENTLYFPGWKIYVDRLTAGIQFQDPDYRGLMTFWIDEGTHDVKVVFTDTKLRRWANTISLVSFIILVMSGIPFLICKTKK